MTEFQQELENRVARYHQQMSDMQKASRMKSFDLKKYYEVCAEWRLSKELLSKYKKHDPLEEVLKYLKSKVGVFDGPYIPQRMIEKKIRELQGKEKSE